MTRKQIAYKELQDAYNEYRASVGLCHKDIETYNDTIKKINGWTAYYKSLIGKPVPMATDKQVALLIKISGWREFNDLAGVAEWELNKFQASELISASLSIHDAIHDTYTTYGLIEALEKEYNAVKSAIVK